MKQNLFEKSAFILLLFFTGGLLLAYIDNRLDLKTLLLESVHTLVVGTIFISCLWCQRKYPDIRQFGWDAIVWGTGFLLIGTFIDILDDPPIFRLFDQYSFPYGPSWQSAFLKKTFGYTAGIGILAYGLFQWVPWMIQTRLNVQKLNEKLSTTNRKLNRALVSLDDHIESERMNISRELHDEVAQQLTYINIQMQLCQKALESNSSEEVRQTGGQLREIARQVSESLKSVRQISGDLRPEPLFALGLVPALEQFLEKMQQQNPDIVFNLVFTPLEGNPGDTHTQLESRMDDGELLHLFRIIQEGVRNAVKHSRAKNISVLLHEVAAAAPMTSNLAIQVEDNGKGLPWQEMPPDDKLIQDGHLGIVGLKERVKELAGEFSLANRLKAPETGLKGTSLQIAISR